MSLICPLETPRLILREFAVEDLPSVHTYSSDPEVARYLTWGPNAEDQSRAFLERVIAAQRDEPRTSYELAIVLKQSNLLIGGIRLGVKDHKNRTADIGYCLHRDHWGQGIMTEAGRALLGFAFNELKLHRVWAKCSAENGGSAQVMRKLGMRREALMLEEEWLKGHWHDTLWYAILEREWQANQ